MPRAAPVQDPAPTLRSRVKGLAVLPCSRIQPDPNNFRLHPERQREALRAVLRDLGSVAAVLVRPSTPGALKSLRRVARGDGGAFQRWLAGYRAGFTLVDGHLRVEEAGPGGEVECLVLDLDDREAAEALATFDAVGDMAELDRDAFLRNAGLFNSTEPLVQELVADLARVRLAEEREAAGVAEAEREQAAGDGSRIDVDPSSGEIPVVDDGSEEVAVDPTDEILEKWAALGCAEGSLWEVPSADGERVHRVLCGDSRVPENVERLMQGRRAKLGQHDPPYGVKIVERGLGSGRREGNSAVPRGKFRPIAGDSAVPNVDHIVGSSERVVLWGANNFPSALPPSNHWIVWDKKITANGEPCADNAFGDAELAFVSGPKADGRVRVIRHLWAGMYRASEHGERRLAPTQKPVAVVAKPIEWWTEPGDAVADWYCGSGTTGLAAERLGRVAYLMEITPRYVAVTLERFSRLGLIPRLVVPGSSCAA